MAQRRMFSKSITNSSQFLMMPQSSQNLYFHLGMNADDDGFCEHFTVMRMTESKPDDLKVLQAKEFVKIFDDKVLVVIDWKENNYIQKDRYTPSKYLLIYKEELKLLSEKSSEDTECIHDVSNMDTQVRLGKVRLGKVSIDNTYTPTPGEFAKNFFSGDEEFIKPIIDTLKNAGISESLIEKEVSKFISYWTESTPNGKKQLWQLKPTFDVKRRLGTWFRNVAERSSQRQQRSGAGVVI